MWLHRPGLEGGLASCGAGAGGRAVAGQAGAVVAGLLTAWEPEGWPGPHTCHAKMDQGASVIVHDASTEALMQPPPMFEQCPH